MLSAVLFREKKHQHRQTIVRGIIIVGIFLILAFLMSLSLKSNVLASTTEKLYISLTEPDDNNTLTDIYNEDIIQSDGPNFEMFFDGSDVGILGNINAFHIVSDTRVLFSLRGTNIPDLPGVTDITESDIIQFDGTTGDNTSGVFSRYFDGSDVGLEIPKEERIDALSLLNDGRLVISTHGNPDVGISGARDEDVLVFTPSSLGDVTAGTWAMYIDAGDLGLTRSDHGINGIHVSTTTTMTPTVYLTTRGSTPLSIGTVDDEDIFSCLLTSEGNTTICTNLSLYFDGSGVGLGVDDIDGISLFDPTEPITNLTLNVTSSQPTCTPPTTFEANVSTGENITYEWFFDYPGSTSMDGPGPSTNSYHYSGRGNYTARVTAYNAVTNPPLEATVNVVVEEPPTASFTPNMITIETGDSVIFTNGSTPAASLTYSWDFGDGSSTSTDKDPTHTYSTAGTYNVTLTVSNDCGPATAIGTVVVEDPPVQTMGGVVAGNTFTQGLWRENEGWVRTVPVVNGTIDWSNASSWHTPPLALSTLPGSGELQSQDSYILNNLVYQTIWRGDEAWSRTIPVVNGIVEWSNASAWSGPIALSSLTIPGTGSIQTSDNFIVGTTLTQAIWRNDEGWSRTVPIVSGSIDWSNASGWSGPTPSTTLPGAGTLQAADSIVAGNVLEQGLWRGNEGWTRTIPIVSGSIDWSNASGWSGPISISTLP
ncbi:MAG: PKD domain-containing protein [Chloroflexota bacterium]